MSAWLRATFQIRTSSIRPAKIPRRASLCAGPGERGSDGGMLSTQGFRCERSDIQSAIGVAVKIQSPRGAVIGCRCVVPLGGADRNWRVAGDRMVATVDRVFEVGYEATARGTDAKEIVHVGFDGRFSLGHAFADEGNHVGDARQRSTGPCRSHGASSRALEPGFEREGLRTERAGSGRCTEGDVLIGTIELHARSQQRAWCGGYRTRWGGQVGGRVDGLDGIAVQRAIGDSVVGIDGARQRCDVKRSASARRVPVHVVARQIERGSVIPRNRDETVPSVGGDILRR